MSHELQRAERQWRKAARTVDNLKWLLKMTENELLGARHELTMKYTAFMLARKKEGKK